MIDERDLLPDNGRAPPFAKPDPKLGEVGTGEGYSGQEYDARGQKEWRAAEAQLRVSPNGEARGTGSPGEEIDPETPGTQERPLADRAADRGPGTSSKSEE